MASRIHSRKSGAGVIECMNSSWISLQKFDLGGSGAWEGWWWSRKRSDVMWSRFGSKLCIAPQPLWTKWSKTHNPCALTSMTSSFTSSLGSEPGLIHGRVMVHSHGLIVLNLKIYSVSQMHISHAWNIKSRTKHISYQYLQLFLVPSSRWSLWNDSQRPCWPLVITPVFGWNLHYFQY